MSVSSSAFEYFRHEEHGLSSTQQLGLIDKFEGRGGREVNFGRKRTACVTRDVNQQDMSRVTRPLFDRSLPPLPFVTLGSFQVWPRHAPFYLFSNRVTLEIYHPCYALNRKPLVNSKHWLDRGELNEGLNRAGLFQGAVWMLMSLLVDLCLPLRGI